MAASRDTRYHEAAHAVAALKLGVGLKEEGMILYSDSNAEVMVADMPNGASEDWIIRRVAAKLAGPLAMRRLRRQELHWDTLKRSREYDTDVEESVRIFRDYWARVGGGGSNDLIDEQMDRSARMALVCIEENETTISAVADAAEGRDQFPRSEIIACIQACQQRAFS